MTTASTTNFENLAGELETLAKSQPITEPDTNDKVAAAAEEAGVDVSASAPADAAPGAADASASAGAAAADGGVTDDEENDEVLGKSFGIKTESGEEVRAYDATALLKALVGRIDAVETTTDGDRQHLGKSLELVTDLLKAQDATIKTQAAELDTLKKAVADLGTAGRGRKSVIAITEKPETALAKSEPEGVSRQDFLAKAESAMKAGKISGQDLILAETYLNRGGAVPEGIVNRVMGNQ